MKVRIVGFPDGGKYDKIKSHKGDKYDSKKGKAGWNASKYDSEKWRTLAEKLGFEGGDTKAFQKFLLTNKDNPKIVKAIETLHKKYGDPNSGDKWDDGYLGVRWDDAYDVLTEPDPVDFKDPEPDEKPVINNEGNQYDFKDLGSKKPGYNKRNLPFYQAAPDLAAFVAAQNTYNYYTPDYTHWEVSPATLNIQPQLNDISAATKSVQETTTGSPQIDNIRKQGAFVAGLNAKQQAYSNKQNYDANMRYQADTFNINARTQEQNLDVQATDRVHNNYRALAKDFATGERLRSINSLTKKYALNEANENKKKLWLDNFFPNFGSDGLTSMERYGNSSFREDYYPVNDKRESLPTYETTDNTTSSLSEASQRMKELGLDPNNPYIDLNPFAKKSSNDPRKSPVYIPEVEDPTFDPIRDQMKPRSFKRGGKINLDY